MSPLKPLFGLTTLGRIQGTHVNGYTSTSNHHRSSVNLAPICGDKDLHIPLSSGIACNLQSHHTLSESSVFGLFSVNE